MDLQSLEDLPTDAICEIINNMPELSLEELVEYMTISKRLNQVIRQCLRHVNAQEKRIVPLEVFDGFSLLTDIQDNVILQVTPQNINVVRTLLSLRSANFLLVGFDDNLTATELLMTELSLSRKLPEVNFKIAYETPPFQVLFIQGDRYMIYPADEQGLIELISLNYPELEYFSYESILTGTGFSANKLLSDRMRRFLIEGDFGLVDPSQPPGPNNLSLNEYTRVLGESGVATASSLILLFHLYIFNNQLVNMKIKWNPDQLMRELFRDSYLRTTRGDYPVQDLSFNQISGIIASATRITPNSFTEYSIPTPLDASAQQQIEQVIDLAQENMRALHRAISRAQTRRFAAPPVYRTGNSPGPVREGFA